MRIDLVTSDQIIWNSASVYADIAQAMAQNQNIEINLLGEGPDLASLGLYDFISQRAKLLNYSLERISVITANALERHNTINIVYMSSIHLIDNAKDYLVAIQKDQHLKHFGLFIGRSNAPRLQLASNINRNYQDKTILSYHFNHSDDFHRSNIGLERLISDYNYPNFDQASEFLKKCPIIPNGSASTVIDTTLDINPAQQLLKNDQDTFLTMYNKFFVELVCESYFTGQTFFPTEKTFRPMLLKTPFIIQGPQYFLHNLRKLGFRTFDRWWSEGYAEDPDGYQIIEILRLVNIIAQKRPNELSDMYQDMLPVLEHNYQLALNLSQEDFNKLCK